MSDLLDIDISLEHIQETLLEANKLKKAELILEYGEKSVENVLGDDL